MLTKDFFTVDCVNRFRESKKKEKKKKKKSVDKLKKACTLYKCLGKSKSKKKEGQETKS